MKYTWLAVPLAVLFTGPTATHLNGAMPQLAPEKSIPPGYAPAPTPNPDLFAPVPRQDLRPQVGPALTRRAPGMGSGGQGYAPGSAYSDDVGRNRNQLGTTLAPTFRLRVPLE